MTETETPASREARSSWLHAMAADVAPRRFALFVTRDDERDALLFGYGSAFDEEAVLFVPEGPDREVPDGFFRFDTPGRARRFFARFGPVHLVWVDPADGTTDPADR